MLNPAGSAPLLPAGRLEKAGPAGPAGPFRVPPRVRRTPRLNVPMDADLGLQERTWPIGAHGHIAGAHGRLARSAGRYDRDGAHGVVEHLVQDEITARWLAISSVAPADHRKVGPPGEVG